MNEFYENACVAADHPCLPGHFPGNPIVPGVLMLEHVAIAIRHWHGSRARIAHFGNVKFVSMLRPAEDFEITLQGEADALRFRCTCGERLLCQGSLTLASAAP